MYLMAQYPERVYAGVCLQNAEGDPDCELSVSFEQAKYQNNVRTINIPHWEAKGPTYARYLASTLWKGETYYMQIDSHTKFVKHWDTKCIGMINQIKELGLSSKPVISSYPKEYSTYETYNESISTMVPRMCKAFFNDRGMISFMGAEEVDSKGVPYKTPYLASGMHFSEAYFLKELPYDPNLDYLFVGEEILHSIRFFTHGWDIFTPSENVVFHYYTRSEQPKIWTDNPYYSDENAFEKVKKYLNLLDKDKQTTPLPANHPIMNNFDKYGLGNVRTLQDYYDFAKIDIENKKVHSNFCRENNLEPTEPPTTKGIIEHFTTTKNRRRGTQLVFIILLVIFAIFIYYFVNKSKSSGKVRK
jgi:hypothetical protein